MKIESISGDTVARCLGISRRQHTNLVANGTLPKADRHRRYNLAAQVDAFIQYRVDGGPKDFMAEKMRETRERADQLALKNARVRGEIVLVEHVGWAFNTLTLTMVSNLNALPGRAAGALAGVTDGGKIREILLVEINAIRTAIATFCERMATSMADTPPDLTKAQITAIQSLIGVTDGKGRDETSNDVADRHWSPRARGARKPHVRVSADPDL